MSGRAELTGKLVYGGVCVAAVGLLGFVAGSVATLSEAPPARVVQDAYRAGSALYSKLTRYRDPLQFDLWRPARSDARGTTVYRPDKVQPGLTLFTTGDRQKAQLIDFDGRVVKEWGQPYSQLWDSSAAVKKPQPDSHIYIEKTRLYPNGDLLAIYVAVGDTPWGYGLVKFDKDNRVLWKYLANAHHDLDVAPDGKVYVLTQAITQDDIPNYPQLKAPRIDDYVAVLSPNGRELKKVRILDVMLRSPYARLLETVPWYVMKGSGDNLHTNSIELLDGPGLRKLPMAKPGQVLLSFREINTVAVMDVEKGEIVWATRGPWLRQHDPDLLANGNLLLFDNLGNVGPGGASRVLEVDPATQAIVWSYAGTKEQPFESEVRSSQARLANGNTLITESDGGRLFEVTPEGEIVWNWVNPVRGKRQDDSREVIPIVSWAERVDPGFLDRLAVASAHGEPGAPSPAGDDN